MDNKVFLGADQLGEFIDGLTLEGFTKSVKEESNPGYDPYTKVTFEKVGDTKITIDIYNSEKWGSAGNGHTEYFSEKQKWWMSFDRRGVEDSFYVDHFDVAKTNEILLKQVERVAKSREVAARSESVPGLGRTVTPEAKAEISAKLKSGKTHTFYPSGFGTGYEVTAKRPRGRFGWKPADPKMAEFFGVPGPLFLIMHDCD